MDEKTKDLHEQMLSTKTDAGKYDQNETEYTEDKNWKSTYKMLMKDREYRKKIIKTCILCWSFVSYGLMVGQMGPSLLDLQELTQTTLSKISAIITASGVGYLIGTILTGIISDRIDIDLICCLSCFGATLTTAAVPWCSIYEIMIFVNLIRGVTNGFLDTAANALLLQLWKNDCPSYMQTLHFSWAFGSIVSPLFTAPFLSKSLKKINPSLTVNITATNNTDLQQNKINDMVHFNQSMDLLTNQSHFVDSLSSNSKLYVPFSITAVFFISAAVLFMVSYCQSTKTTYITKETEKERNEDTKLPRLLHYTVLANLLLMMMVYVAVEGALGTLIATFSVKMLNWSKVNASYLTAVFSASFTAGRFSGIFVVKCLNSSKTIIIYTMILTITLTIFLICSLFTFDIGIWICVAISGIAGSVMFPGILTWAEKDFLRMTRRITCCILVCSSFGWMFNPLLVGTLMDNYSPMYFCYVCLGECLLLVCLYIPANFLSRKVKSYRYKARKNKAFVV